MATPKSQDGTAITMPMGAVEPNQIIDASQEIRGRGDMEPLVLMVTAPHDLKILYLFAGQIQCCLIERDWAKRENYREFVIEGVGKVARGLSLTIRVQGGRTTCKPRINIFGFVHQETNKGEPMTKKTEDQFEASCVERAMQANAHARKVFGAQSNQLAANEIYDYLEAADDEADFLADLDRLYTHCKAIYDTPTPTPEQTFGLFERIYGEEE